jgi:hypothetical protein
MKQNQWLTAESASMETGNFIPVSSEIAAFEQGYYFSSEQRTAAPISPAAVRRHVRNAATDFGTAATRSERRRPPCSVGIGRTAIGDTSVAPP